MAISMVVGLLANIGSGQHHGHSNLQISFYEIINISVRALDWWLPCLCGIAPMNFPPPQNMHTSWCTYFNVNLMRNSESEMLAQCAFTSFST